MAQALVGAGQATVYGQASDKSERLGQLLCGMAVQVQQPEKEGWLQVQGPLELQGYVQVARLVNDAKAAEGWQGLAKKAVRCTWLDVLEAADAAAPRMATLPRGALVHPLAGADEAGWRRVALADGRQGFVRAGNLMPYITDGSGGEEQALREALAASALSYLGCQYRLGGNTPKGMDAAGLVAMAGFLNGVTIPRSLRFTPGGPLRAVERNALAMGDIVYFAGHVAMYLGEGKYVHATGMQGSDGVVINSLDEDSPFYREDLATGVVACASPF